jgi:hypothetical protein
VTNRLSYGTAKKELNAHKTSDRNAVPKKKKRNLDTTDEIINGPFVGEGTGSGRMLLVEMCIYVSGGHFEEF